MTIKDEVPHTEQALKNYQMYAENALKENKLQKRRLEKALEICDKRLKEIKNGKK